MRTLDPQVTSKVRSRWFLCWCCLFCVLCATQTQLADLEHSHSLCESLARQREESQRDAERLRSSFKEAERTLGARERVHRHRVKGLEEQVSMSWEKQTISGSQQTCGFMFGLSWAGLCLAAGIHPEGAAAAGDEETTTFSSTPPHVYRKLR